MKTNKQKGEKYTKNITEAKGENLYVVNEIKEKEIKNITVKKRSRRTRKS